LDHREVLLHEGMVVRRWRELRRQCIDICFSDLREKREEEEVGVRRGGGRGGSRRTIKGRRERGDGYGG